MNYTYPNYLCHHGVKGMKWGVRKSRRYSGGVTKNGKPISNRKARRALNRVNKHPGKNFKQAMDEMDREYINSKEYQIVSKNMHSEGATLRQIENAMKKRNEIGKKYVEISRSAALKDLGYDDTKAGRDFIGQVATEHIKKKYGIK